MNKKSDKQCDLTFFNQVKAKFSAAPGTIVLISVDSQNVDELVPQVFTQETYGEFDRLIYKHLDDEKAYFAIIRLEPREYEFLGVCREFMRREVYPTGRVLEYDLDPFKEIEVDLDQLRVELAQLAKLLNGDSEAS